ncbi:DNA-processing protein DprA [Microbacterium aurantiacum]|uniref:DNA-processing protein DprA n=1 Tax=Microbacterium aurantiacum TaxID=162393 RepID=UPI00343C660E
MSTVTEITAATHPDLFARITRLDTPPASMWAVGNVDLLSDSAPRVMVTGARACTAYGEHITGELVTGMRRDVTLVTGLAYGIEGSAVRAALASGRPLIVVSASGLDRPYPLGHTDLHRRVIDAGGVVISSAPIGAVPTRHRFLERGRIAAALSDAVIITEAGPRSGALHTAATAHDLGIPRGAVPGPITSPASMGANVMLSEGAHVITSADSIDALVPAVAVV